jgi:hypothetical protein
MLQSQPKITGILYQSSCLFFLFCVIYSIRHFRFGVLSLTLQPRRWCCSIRRCSIAYSTWRQVTPGIVKRIWSIVQYARKYKVWILSRTSRVVWCLGVFGIRTENVQSIVKVLSNVLESEWAMYAWATSILHQNHQKVPLSNLNNNVY